MSTASEYAEARERELHAQGRRDFASRVAARACQMTRRSGRKGRAVMLSASELRAVVEDVYKECDREHYKP